MILVYAILVSLCAIEQEWELEYAHPIRCVTCTVNMGGGGGGEKSID